MDTEVVRIENLGKLYRLGEVGTGTLSHDLNRWFAKIRGKEDPFAKVGQVNDRSKIAETDYVWALRNVSFSVKKGEVLGIIGKNGAGKSTLLKLISRITAPTEGSIKAKGRIASLLEVGTGMHPEMTARENVFLNGAILGMTKKEIKLKFDEILDFAGCVMYVDTPIKRFSSGMKVRLAFAVAAFLEPEILIVDEVLAVGDAEFQKKAIGKMQEISGGGERTVLFVSHNMAAVKNLCTRALVLKNGGILFSGDVDEVVAHYMKDGAIDENNQLKRFIGDDEIDNPYIRLIEIGIKSVSKEYGKPMNMNDDLEFFVNIHKKSDDCKIDTTVQIKDAEGNYLFASGSGQSNVEDNTHYTGELLYKLLFPRKFFNCETFFINLLIVKNNREKVLDVRDILSFTIVNSEQKDGTWLGKSKGPLKPELTWDLKKVNSTIASEK